MLNPPRLRAFAPWRETFLASSNLAKSGNTGPVPQLQSGHTAKLIPIARDQGEVVGPADGGDFEIVGTDDLASGLQMMADVRVVMRRRIIEGQ